jgi:hypothetical protein
MTEPSLPVRQSYRKDIAVEQLLLDPENPRLVMAPNSDQASLARVLYEQEGIDELVPSLVQNGYFAEEPLVVVPNPAGKSETYLVVEGNRRLTALKLLLDADLRRTIQATDLPKLTDTQRERLLRVPCVVYNERALVLPFLGFRHITGAKKWAPFQKARFIAQLIDNGYSLKDVQALIGDTTQTVKKLYQDYVVFQQITVDLDIPARPIRDRFSLLEVALGQRPIKKFLGVSASLPVEPAGKLVPDSKLDELEEVTGWVFGTADKKPVISDSREITSRLAQVVGNDEALAHLRRTNDLETAYEFSGGEKAFLMKKLVAAERSLQDISGVIPLYTDDPDVLAGVARLEALVNALGKVAH